MAGITNGTTNGEVNGTTANVTTYRTAMNGTMDSAVVNGVKKAAILAEEEVEVPELDTIEDTIEAFKRGEFIVVLDSTSRENEGDLIIAAEDVTTEKMAFMIRHTSGLICAPLPPSLTHSLSLPQMTSTNTDLHQTAYTISVDASQSIITTGISAHDRALTCRTLASPTATPQSFRRPGHLFPLRAREGGVKERRGHTEAAVEFCRLAGKREVGVISELVDEGVEVEGKAEVRGSGMLRRDGCLRFGRRWGLRVCTIERLCEFLEREGR